MKALKPLRGDPALRSFGTYDLEWIPHTLELRIAGAYDADRGYRWYPTIREYLAAELCRENEGRWIFAHAGGRFDLRFLLTELIDCPEGRSVECVFSGSSCVAMTVARGHHSWTFCDSYFLLRAPLRQIAQGLGMEKGGSTTPRARCRYPAGACTCDRLFWSPLPELRAYNEHDCRILYTAIDRFQAEILALGGQMEKTAASTAMGLFRRRYLERTIPRHPRVNDAARLAYVASRVEVFERTCEEANYFDINSSFPYSMTFPAPGRVDGWSRRWDGRDTALVNARVTVPMCEVPPLPYRTAAGRLFHPMGTWEAWHTAADLQTLEESGGTIEQVSEAIHFAPFLDLRGYVEAIYALRRVSTDAARRDVLKILLNSLYGKFAERSAKQTILIHPPSYDCPHVPQHEIDRITGVASCYEFLLPGVWALTTERDVGHAHVVVAAHVTALSRRWLCRHLRASSERYYCDTDGFACSTGDRFATSTELGGLKLEKTIREGRFVSPKVYAMRTDDAWTVRAKGFPSLTYGELVGLIEGETITSSRMGGIREAFRRGLTAPTEEPRPKRFLGKAREKRAFFADGTSRPWHVDELA